MRIPRKERLIQWLTARRKEWAAKCNHDGRLDTEQRNVSFDQYLSELEQ